MTRILRVLATLRHAALDREPHPAFLFGFLAVAGVLFVLAYQWGQGRI